jgi:hypothetical protein
MLRPSFVHAGLALALFAAPLGVSAQPAPPTGAPVAASTDVARTQFEAGVAHMAESHWQEAAEAFDASMRARATASSALNLGISLKNLGRLVEARVRLQQFLEMASAEQHREHDTRVQGLLGEIARGVARVHIADLSPATAVVSIDNRRAQLNEAGEAVVDPGAHTVRAEAPGYVPFEERVELAPGGTRDLRVAMAAAPSVVAAPTTVERVVVVNQPAPTQPAARPLYRQWWFWTIIGGAVVAGAVAGVAGVTSGQTRALPPTSTNVTINGILSGEGAL